VCCRPSWKASASAWAGLRTSIVSSSCWRTPWLGSRRAKRKALICNDYWPDKVDLVIKFVRWLWLSDAVECVHSVCMWVYEPAKVGRWSLRPCSQIWPCSHTSCPQLGWECSCYQCWSCEEVLYVLAAWTSILWAFDVSGGISFRDPSHYYWNYWLVWVLLQLHSLGLL